MFTEGGEACYCISIRLKLHDSTLLRSEKYASPECAAAVRKMLMQKENGFKDEPSNLKLDLYKELKAAASEGGRAFGELAMLC